MTKIIGKVQPDSQSTQRKIRLKSKLNQPNHHKITTKIIYVEAAVVERVSKG